MFYSVAMKQKESIQTEEKEIQKNFEKKRAEAYKEFLKIHFCQACIDQFAASY
jgi:hypothetical protein